MTLNVLQVTDTHLFPAPDESLLGVRTQDTLDAVLDQAFREGTPDALIASGDLAQVGEVATYRRFLETVRSRFTGPCLCVPGNHDLGEPFLGILPTRPLRLGAWDVLGVDTHIDHRVDGEVGEGELRRLEEALSAAGSAGRHALVVGHHCPVDVGAPWLDEHRIANADALLGLLGGCDRVRGYLGGHVHQEVDQRVGRLRILASPSTCFQFAPGSERFTLDDAAPGWRWLTLHADGAIETRVGRLPSRPAPSGAGSNHA